MSFLESDFLYFMLPPFFVLVYFIVKDKNNLRSYFKEDILKKIVILGDKLGNQGRNISLLIALFFMIIALARPISDKREVEIESAKSTLIVALDISRSMLVSDVYPNRLDFAKNRLLWLIDALPNTNIGVVAFAKDAFLVSPATLDGQSLAFFLENLSPDVVSRQGTDITNALMQVSTLFEKNDSARRVLVVSDGGDGKDIQNAIKIAKTNNLQVSVMIVGTNKGGVIKDTQGLLKDMDGNIVISKRDDTMIELSTQTDGVFIQEYGEGKGIKLLKNALFEDAKQLEAKKKRVLTKKEWFLVPLLFALVFLFVALHGLPRKKIAFIFLFYLLTLPFGNLYGGIFDFYHIDKAKKALEKKEYDEALKEYEKLENSSHLAYNKGSIYYKKGEYEKAIKEFRGIKSENQNLSFKTQYNLGNSYAKSKQLEEALKAYENALKLNPTDKDTISNIEYIKKQIEKQQKKQNEKQQQDKNSQMQNKNKKFKDSKSQSDNKAKNESQKGQTKKKEEEKKSDEKQEGQQSDQKANKKANVDEKRSGQGAKKGTSSDKNFSMSDQEAQKWENELTKFKPLTKPRRLGKKSEYKGEDIKNAW